MPNRKNIQHISDAFLCSSCGACKAICSRDAIDFHFTNIGRLKADVNSRCIDCGLCLKVCPSYTQISGNETGANPYVGNVINTYIGRALDDEIYQNSQSGGICTALTSYLLASKKVDAVIVCKISAGTSPYSKATIVREKEELRDCQRSCYTQLDLLSALRGVETNECIAVVGIACQIEGLTLLQKVSKKYNILYKIGLICDRSHCLGYQETILSFSPTSAKRLIYWKKKDFSHNKKYYSYKDAPIVVSDERGRTSIFPNLFRFSLKDFFTPPRCRVCRDKINVFADIVLGDPWGMSNVDWNHGNSVVISRTEKGQNLLVEAMKASVISLVAASTEEMLQGQHINERKTDVARYVRAFHHFIPVHNSWLIEQKNTSSLDTQKVESATKDLMDFRMWESKTKREIIREGQKRIALATGIWHPSLYGYRVCRKIEITLSALYKKIVK